MRIIGDKQNSYAVLQDHIVKLAQSSYGQEVPLSPRDNGQRGELVLSYAANLLSDRKTSEAAKVLESWTPLSPENPSPMELDVSRHKHVMLGRVLRNEGHFQEAIYHYETLTTDAYKEEDPSRQFWKSQAIVHLSDLYCEMENPWQSMDVLQPELDLYRERNWETTPRGTDLLLCHLEVLVRQGHLDEAQQGLVKLNQTFKGNENPDMLTKTKHFRVHAALARIWHMKQQWNEAQVGWYAVLGFLEKQKWTNCFNEAVTLFSLAQVLYRMDQKAEAEKAYKKAHGSLEHEGVQYWLLGLGSYWYKFVAVPLGESGPDPIVTKPLTHNTNAALDVFANLAEQMQLLQKI